MEASTLDTTGVSGLRGPTPLLRLQSDERLVTLTRRGNQAAYEALVSRYQARLLAFCRHMLGSKEDAEDVLQEVFAAAYSALLTDERAINVRPWFYRIARNRSLNHLRRKTAVGVDSMDIHLADHGTTTADRVHQREEFRLLMGDVQELAETQRTALLLREIDNLSYEQIAEAMDTTVPSVKSLLVRARVGLAEASEARALSCEDVRQELGEVAEGLRKLSAPSRRHCRQCERCGAFRDHLKDTNKALALMFPVAPFLLFKKFILAQVGTTASASTATTVATSAGTAGAGSALSATVSAIATKTVAGLAAAAIVTAGAVEVNHVRSAPSSSGTPVAAAITPIGTAPVAVRSESQPEVALVTPKDDAAAKAAAAKVAVADPLAPTVPVALAPPADPAAPVAPVAPADGSVQTGGDTTVLPTTPSDPIPANPGAGSSPDASRPLDPVVSDPQPEVTPPATTDPSAPADPGTTDPAGTSDPAGPGTTDPAPTPDPAPTGDAGSDPSLTGGAVGWSGRPSPGDDTPPAS